MIQPLPFILSIQSHVSYGYVGNRAAVIPLQAMGYDVIAVHTVQLSNHTGYGDFAGDFFSVEHIQNVINGVEARGVFPQIGAVLTGYLGNPELGQVVLDTVRKIKAAAKATHNGQVHYICDPVMGDVDGGFYVKDAIPPFFKGEVLSLADIITPNQFELEYLAACNITNKESALGACSLMHDKGVKMVLLTSLEAEDTPRGYIQMLLSVANGESYLISTPKIDFEIPLNGSGDTTAALFGGYILGGDTPKIALEKTASAIYGVFEETKKYGRRELAMPQKIGSFAQPEIFFHAQSL